MGGPLACPVVRLPKNEVVSDDAGPGDTAQAWPMSALQRAFQGEVFGLAMYEALAAAQTDPWRRWHWRCLARLEQELLGDLEHLLRRLGAVQPADPGEHDAGVAEARRLLDKTWTELISEFALDLPELVEEYSEIARHPVVVADRGGAGELVARLVEHEVAALSYCRAELAGDPPLTSIGPVIALLRDPPPPPAGADCDHC